MEASTSKRFRIVTAFKEVVQGVSPPGGVWRATDLTPLLKVSPTLCPGFSVFDFQEVVMEEGRPSNDLVKAQLYIVVEVYGALTQSDNASMVLNQLLRPIQKALAGNTLGGLCQRVSEVGSKFKVESQDQRLVSVESAWRATYMRGIND